MESLNISQLDLRCWNVGQSFVDWRNYKQLTVFRRCCCSLGQREFLRSTNNTEEVERLFCYENQREEDHELLLESCQ